MSMRTDKLGKSSVTVIRCDWKPSTPDYAGPGHCEEVFRSFSDAAIVERQATAKGWTVKEEYRKDKSDGSHLCPAHQGAPRFMMPRQRNF